MAIDRWSGLGAVLAVGLAVDLAVGLAFGLAIGLDAERGFLAGVAADAPEHCDHEAPVPVQLSAEDRSTPFALDGALSLAGDDAGAWAFVEGPCAAGACLEETRLVDLDGGPSRDLLARRQSTERPPVASPALLASRADSGSPRCEP